MIGARLVGAGAGVLTALLVQVAVVAPLAVPVPVSLPAVLVAAVALEAGPGAGMSMGFCAGLLADLTGDHPAGVLALGWLVLGVGSGVLADDRRWAGRVLIVAVATAAVATVTGVALAALGADGSSVDAAVRAAPATLLGDGLLALVVVPLIGPFFRSSLRRTAVMRPADAARRASRMSRASDRA